MTNYYDIIGVLPSASAVDIKARYRELCKIYHPDVGGDQKRMAELNEAYKILANPASRSAYDQARLRKQAAAAQAAAQAAQQRQRPQRKAAEQTPPTPKSVFTAPSPKNKNTSRFWQFMAWTTAAYVILGSAILYFIANPSVATSDAPATNAPSSTLTQEAADASAAIPTATVPTTSTNAPAQTTETNLPSTDESATATNSAGEPEPSTPTSEDQSTDQQANNERPRRHIDWRRLFNNNE